MEGQMEFQVQGGLCEMAQDLWNNFQARTTLELGSVKLGEHGESIFTVYSPMGQLGRNWSVTFRMNELPGQDYYCRVQLMWVTQHGHKVDDPKVYLNVHQLASYVTRWFGDMYAMNSGLVQLFGEFPRKESA